MSWKAAGKVKELTEDITRSEKLTLLILADYYSDATGRCDPSIGRLADECLISERHLVRVLQSLDRKGLIRIIKRPGKRNQYDLLVLGGDVVSGVEGEEGVTSHQEGVTPDVTSGVTQLGHPNRKVTVSPNRNGSDLRHPSSKDSSDRAPAAPRSVTLQARFLAAAKVNERVAVVIRLFVQEGIELTPQQKAHLGALLKRRGHGIAVWRAALAATTAEGDPIEMMEGGARNAATRNGHRKGTRVTDADDLAAAKRGW